MGESTYPLSPEQQSIAEAPPERPMLVLAPPGTGKTHTVVARIRYLIEQCGLQPYELLVLCFSRAAVREIMKRLVALIRDHDVHDDLRFVSVRTFDSFATRLLISSDTSRNLSGLGYDARIELAVHALSSPDSNESEIVSGIRHLIVDEIQDLVGVRAELVSALLVRISGGFTLLGDPAQSIYGFARQKETDLTPDALLERLKAQKWFEPLYVGELSTNFRTTSKASNVASSVREQILSVEQADSRPLERLRELINNLDSSGSSLHPDDNLSKPPEGSVCILCRTNGEVLQIASMLATKSVRFRLRPRLEDSGLPAWIGRALGTFTGSHLSYAEFEQRWLDLIGPDSHPDRRDAWNWLKRVEGAEGNVLKIRTLHERLWQGQRLPDEADAFLNYEDGGLSLSTIHSVKGREFDHVIILGPADELPDENNNPLEEARIFYVAATRAREALSRLDRQGLPQLWRLKDDSTRSRWISRNPYSGYYFIEVGLPGDVEEGSAVNKYIHENPALAQTAQDYIWKNVQPGTEVFIREVVRGPYHFYRLSHRLTETSAPVNIGQLSRQFFNHLKFALKKYSGGRFKYPDYLLGIRVAAVVTDLLPPFSETALEPFATSRFCLGVRLRGMGYLLKE